MVGTAIRRRTDAGHDGEVAAKGFLIAGSSSRNTSTSIVDELVPALQRRQLTRTEYAMTISGTI